jgi:hypothetical protein
MIARDGKMAFMKHERAGCFFMAACLAGLAQWAHGAEDAGRRLIAIQAPQHDPLYLDAASVQRSGSSVSFKYLLDVLSAPDDSGKPREWRSNEIEASIDCQRHTVVVRKLVTYPGPRGSGAATAVHSFSVPAVRPAPIAPKSTFAYLESHVCRGS